MSFWDRALESATVAAAKAGVAAKIAGQKTKVRTEIAFTDREIISRKERFGVEMYDKVSPWTDSQDFYAADDILTVTLRPPLLNANKEISALQCRVVKIKEEIAAAEARRAGAFPVPATTWGDKLYNAGVAATMHGGEAKLKTDLYSVEQQILAIKYKFGLDLYEVFAALEDSQGWLPTDRDVRAIYDQCRRDLVAIQEKKEKKQQALRALGGSTQSSSSYNPNTRPGGFGQQEQSHTVGRYGADANTTLSTQQSGSSGQANKFGAISSSFNAAASSQNTGVSNAHAPVSSSNSSSFSFIGQSQSGEPNSFSSASVNSHHVPPPSHSTSLAPQQLGEPNGSGSSANATATSSSQWSNEKEQEAAGLFSGIVPGPLPPPPRSSEPPPKLPPPRAPAHSQNSNNAGMTLNNDDFDLFG